MKPCQIAGEGYIYSSDAFVGAEQRVSKHLVKCRSFYF